MAITLPVSIEAERTIIGAMILNNDAYYEVSQSLSSGDFYLQAHRTLVETIGRMIGNGLLVDLITLQDDLHRQGKLENVGGIVRLAELLDGVPMLTQLSSHIRIVREKAQLRRLYALCMDLGNKALGEQASGELLEAAQQRIFSLVDRGQTRDFVGGADLEVPTHRLLEALYCERNSVTGLATGFPAFDRLTSGLQPSDLVIIAARPSMGKTALALNIARYVAMDLRKTVAVFSLEMSAMQLFLRLLCSDACIDSRRIRNGYLSRDEFRKLISTMNRAGRSNLLIDDSPSLTPLSVHAKCRRLKAEKGLDLVVIDYLQLMSPPKESKGQSRTQQVSEISRALKMLAKDLDVPVIALSQLNRNIEHRPKRRPQLSDLRESGAIEQDADLVAFIYRDDLVDEENANTAELLLEKQRNGPTGLVNLVFLKNYTRFESAYPIRTGEPRQEASAI